MNIRDQLRLYLVTDPLLCADLGLVETVRLALKGGVSMVQLRDKEATTSELVNMALALKEVLAGSNVSLVINDNVKAARIADVDGAHIGQGDISPTKAREILGPDKILGLSCETPETVRAVDPKLVNYLGLGPVFGTATKSDHEKPIGFDGLRRLVDLSPLPNVAIGGLKAHHQDDVLASGVDGIAVVSAICGQPDIIKATKAFDAHSKTRVKHVLSIAGSDPSGGAGIQADLKAISANGAYAMAAITALTAQNTKGVSDVHHLPPSFVGAQIQAVFDDIRVDGVKIGMIATADIARAVARALADVDCPIILDPVMIAKGGAALLDPSAVSVLCEELLPLAHVLTPNLPEAAHLLDQPVASTRDEMEEQGQALIALGADSVLMKGGHLDGDESPDCLITSDAPVWFEAPRRVTQNTHGTGCTLSSALATQLARGHNTNDAVKRAKAYVATAIDYADHLEVGHGHGPTHHFGEIYAALNKD